MDWDERFARGEQVHGGLPSPPLPEAIAGVTPGTALDLASGPGRHAIFLAERGWKVHAIDSSRVGIQRMLDEAYQRKVTIEAEVADLEAPGFRLDREYDLVCDLYFLHRPLFDEIRKAVRPGGLFVAAIHVGTGRFVLDPGELRRLFEDWEILHYREGESRETEHRHPTAELIARRVAILRG
jgi:SAM-dependent methyltransferase